MSTCIHTRISANHTYTQSVQTAYTFGSYGLQKFWINTNLGNKTNAAKLTYSNTHSDGYRENNELDRQTITLASNHYLNEKNNLNVLANSQCAVFYGLIFIASNARFVARTYMINDR